MSIPVLAISFDAHNAAELAQFWAQALHRSVADVTIEATSRGSSRSIQCFGSPQLSEASCRPARWRCQEHFTP